MNVLVCVLVLSVLGTRVLIHEKLCSSTERFEYRFWSIGTRPVVPSYNINCTQVIVLEYGTLYFELLVLIVKNLLLVIIVFEHI